MKSYVGFLVLGLFLALSLGVMGNGWLRSGDLGRGNLAIAQVPASGYNLAQGSPLPDPPAVPEASPLPTPVVNNNETLSTEPAEFELEELPVLPDVDTAGLTLSETLYEKPGQFQVGVLEDYRTSTNAGVAIIESPSRDLAYTVQVQQRANDRQLIEDELVQIAIDRLQRGEGFQLGMVRPVDTGVLMVDWTATLGGTPLFGRVLLRQVDSQVLMLVVSATEEKSEQLDAVISLLSGTLQPEV
ncbi:hypothetical protein NEA10_03555 [Phormidium yuhuli AB48]|uniref:DUF1795 domain-containing protein n=1 Tax=Phormidium yuhuli AB48 TaxID=2940671 RepID=A0ABY5ARG9_9CYAN|nr:hypothetical protein [Phormidium yuhuli]USR91815.1 hypothetical protein NEA10_03555 [Phormidium yuhuli AB48]